MSTGVQFKRATRYITTFLNSVLLYKFDPSDPPILADPTRPLDWDKDHSRAYHQDSVKVIGKKEIEFHVPQFFPNSVSEPKRG